MRLLWNRCMVKEMNKDDRKYLRLLNRRTYRLLMELDRRSLQHAKAVDTVKAQRILIDRQEKIIRMLEDKLYGVDNDDD